MDPITLVGMGVGLLGSLFGKKEKKQETVQTVDYVKMAENAEKAGFNPLTAIRNGGSAGFTTTIHPALSEETPFGSAMGMLSNFLMSYDARADERADLELSMQRIQLQRLQTSGDSGKSHSFDVPVASGSTRKPAPLGTKGNPYELFKYAKTEDGRIIRINNPDLGLSIEDVPAGDAAIVYDGVSDSVNPKKVKPWVDVPKILRPPQGTPDQWTRPKPPAWGDTESPGTYDPWNYNPGGW